MSIEDDTITETAIEVRSAFALVAGLPLFRDLEPELLSEIASEIEWFSLAVSAPIVATPTVANNFSAASPPANPLAKWRSSPAKRVAPVLLHYVIRKLVAGLNRHSST
jgi:hypothetical protein